VATAGAVATERASAWFPEAQLEIKSAAATAALGCRAAGRICVVVGPVVDEVVAGDDVVEVEATAPDPAGLGLPARWTTASARALAAIAASTMMYATFLDLDIIGAECTEAATGRATGTVCAPAAECASMRPFVAGFSGGCHATLGLSSHSGSDRTCPMKNRPSVEGGRS
jgi:hypothetical protein